MVNNYIFFSLTLYEYANEEYMKMKSTYALLLVSSLILVACDSKDKKALLLPLASVTGSQAQGAQGVPGVQITGEPFQYLQQILQLIHLNQKIQELLRDQLLLLIPQKPIFLVL